MKTLSPMRPMKDGYAPLPWLFRRRAVGTWVVVGVFCLYLLGCWFLFFYAVDPVADFSFQPTVEADSPAYWTMSGVSDAHLGEFSDDQTYLALGNSLGPVLLAKLFRTRAMIGIFDCLLLLVVFRSAGHIPGVRRELFAVLILLNALTMPSLVTLNKEILAFAGLVFFARYIYAKTYRIPLLFWSLLFSGLARWEQIVILLTYLALENRLSPVRGRHGRGVFLVVAVITVAYPIALHSSRVDLSAFLAQVEGAGVILRLDTLQGQFGFPLVVFPKILMNVLGRLVTPTYFLTDFWSGDFSDLQNQFFQHAHVISFGGLLLVAFLRNRLRLARPLPYLLLLYFVFTSVNPFIQPRYQYPAYGLLCLEMSRRSSALEPVKKRWTRRMAEMFAPYSSERARGGTYAATAGESTLHFSDDTGRTSRHELQL